MKSRTEFIKALVSLKLTEKDRAIALLWYYRQTQEYDERSAIDLANDLFDEGFPKPNISRLSSDLKRSRIAIQGRRPGTFQLDVRRIADLDKTYSPIYSIKTVKVLGSLLPFETVSNTRRYIEQMAYQINGTYEYGFYDACVVMCRRLIESLLVEIYISRGRHNEIQQGGTILPLEKLITHLKSDRSIPLGRTTPKSLDLVKELGDTAAHDRTYITTQLDIDDIRPKLRKLVTELLILSGVMK
jgi:hypothetical protein